ncbi:hypothetical protein AC579_9635 [Pseudocercospora musae]|uniref:Uncharacterized protein n=1 Tax=Pseudocercospora musae TaxID=113226 RepID=A0A139ITN0_9PEZI|nr:hypothetical protein AC579_9635 [Pseudocercospora musae]
MTQNQPNAHKNTLETKGDTGKDVSQNKDLQQEFNNRPQSIHQASIQEQSVGDLLVEPEMSELFVHLGRDCTHGRSKDGREFWLIRKDVLEGKGDYNGAVETVDVIWGDTIRTHLACVLEDCKMCRDMIKQNWGEELSHEN